jgi:hypothetical protein
MECVTDLLNIKQITMQLISSLWYPSIFSAMSVDVSSRGVVLKIKMSVRLGTQFQVERNEHEL